MHELLIICDDCKRMTPDTEGDIRTAFEQEFSLCERCVREWDEYGIPNHVAATYAG